MILYEWFSKLAKELIPWHPLFWLSTEGAVLAPLSKFTDGTWAETEWKMSGHCGRAEQSQVHSFDWFFEQWMQIGDVIVPFVLLLGLWEMLLGPGAGEHAGQYPCAPWGGGDSHLPAHWAGAVPTHLSADDFPRSWPLSGFHWVAPGKKGFIVCPVEVFSFEFHWVAPGNKGFTVCLVKFSVFFCEEVLR